MRTMYENNNYITYSSILKYLLDSFNASKAFIGLPCHKKKVLLVTVQLNTSEENNNCSCSYTHMCLQMSMIG